MFKSLLLTFVFLVSIFINGIAQEEKFIPIAVYNFTRYVEWPSEDASENFFIDVIGHKSIYEKLKEASVGRMVGKRNVVVRYLESVNDITHSHILFIGFWQSKDLAKAIDKIGNAHTLLICEKDGLIDAGAGINFVVRDNIIKFEIKRTNIQKYGLLLSKDLEQMAYKSY